MRLILLPPRLAVCRLPPTAPVPQWPAGPFVAMTRTADELSIVCSEESAPNDVRSERGWRCLKIEGPIPFATIGVAAAVTKALADAKVSVFFVSTYDTDYVLVRSESLDAAVSALRAAGFDL
ncbi:MAG: ACT domain-containing protein [Thermoanaerobaculia bacterium]